MVDKSKTRDYDFQTLSNKDLDLLYYPKKENEDFLWELWIEREATFCGNMGEYTEVEYYVVHKILADIEKSRKKRKSR